MLKKLKYLSKVQNVHFGQKYLEQNSKVHFWENTSSKVQNVTII